MKRYLGMMCMLLMSMVCLSALESYKVVLPYLNEAEYQALERGESVKGDTLGGNDITTLAPVDGAFLERIESTKRISDEKNFAMAYVSLLPYPDGWRDASQAKRQLDLFNTMRQISTQEGITYISSRRGNKPYPLFKESYYLSDPEDTTSKIPDPVVDVLPQSLVAYAYQFDTSFDGNIYKHTFTTSDKEIFLDITNMTPIKFRGITGLKKETLSLCLATYQTDEGILLFSLAEVKNRAPEVKILFWSVSLPGAFEKRINAVSGWFQRRLEVAK